MSLLLDSLVFNISPLAPRQSWGSDGIAICKLKPSRSYEWLGCFLFGYVLRISSLGSRSCRNFVLQLAATVRVIRAELQLLFVLHLPGSSPLYAAPALAGNAQELTHGSGMCELGRSYLIGSAMELLPVRMIAQCLPRCLGYSALFVSASSYNFSYSSSDRCQSSQFFASSAVFSFSYA